MIAHVAGVPIEELLLPIASAGGMLALAVRGLLARLHRLRSHGLAGLDQSDFDISGVRDARRDRRAS
jgi:hypothetical protein